jgi:pimeloyl-ACP methyl ester carboxylesterase
MSSLRNQHLVFMPGMDGTGLSFEPLAPFLSRETKITIVRYPTDRLLSFDETVECAAGQIPADKPPIVIAESFSGPVAIKMIGSGRIKAKALILCATFAKSPRPVVWRVMRFLRLPMLIKPEMPKRFFRVVIGNDKLIDKLKPLWKKVHAKVPARVMQHRLKIINEVDVTAWLAKINIPCCYLQAITDRVVPASCAEEIKKAAPLVEIIKIDSPHFILQAEPKECLTAIEKFMVSSNLSK